MIKIVGFIGIERSIGDNYLLSTRIHVLKVIVQASPLIQFPTVKTEVKFVVNVLLTSESAYFDRQYLTW